MSPNLTDNTQADYVIILNQTFSWKEASSFALNALN
jgi:hypothetical protein